MIDSYAVGIDLGTTNAVVAYVGMAGNTPIDHVQVLPIGQWVGEGIWQEQPLFPTYRYHTLPHEANLLLNLPFPYAPLAKDFPVLFGEYAVQLGALNRGQGVASAKSWLSQAAQVHQDPNDAFLPFGANPQASETVALISPVLASASFLHYLQAWWNHRFPDFPLDQQTVVITVPASFDEYARDLTLTAAELAGLPEVKLLEEPTAAAYAWQQTADARQRAQARVMCVLDVGGGTTDLSIIDFSDAAQPKRLAVGDHLMLGGDNLDASIARKALESMGNNKVSPAQWSQFMLAARDIKERVFAPAPPATLNISLLGRGKSLIAQQRQVVFDTAALRQELLSGFLPQLDFGPQQLARAQSGLVQIGLQFEANPAITAHLAHFLAAQSQPINSVLLNGGFFQSQAFVEQIDRQFQHWAQHAWQGQRIEIFQPTSPQSAVAIGAALYAQARVQLEQQTATTKLSAPIIGGGASRSLVLLLDSEPGMAAKGLVVMARGTQEMRKHSIETSFRLAVNQAVEFCLFSTTEEVGAIGTLVDIQSNWLQLPALQTSIELDLEGVDTALAEFESLGLPVQLYCELTGVGALQLEFKSAVTDLVLPPAYLEFAGRAAAAGLRIHKTNLPTQWPMILSAVKAAYGPRDAVAAIIAADFDEKQILATLKKQLEQILGPRPQWNMTVCRYLADELLRWRKNRRRSSKHESTWLTLVGFCMRPGYGVVGDGHRMAYIKNIIEQGPGHHEYSVWFAWWTLVRRCAGAIDQATQLALFAKHEKKVKNTLEYLKSAGRQVNQRSKLGSSSKNSKTSKNALSNKEQELRVRAPDAMLPALASLQFLRGQTWFEQLLFRLYKTEGLGVNQKILAWCYAQIVKPTAAITGVGQTLAVDDLETQIKLWLAEDWQVCPEFGLAASLAVQLQPENTFYQTSAVGENLRQKVEQKLQAKGLPRAWLEAIRHGLSAHNLQEALAGERLPQGLKLK